MPVPETTPEPERSDEPEPTIDYITIKNIEYSTSLTELTLWETDLQDEDIAPLKYMKELTKLRLVFCNNYISDLTPLADLSSLSRLLVFGNPIGDFTDGSRISGTVFAAYYDILIAAVNEYGFGVDNESYSYYPNSHSGVIHAELIDFDNDGMPELLYAFAEESEEYEGYYETYFVVYGFSSDRAELLGKHRVWNTHVGAEIAYDRDGFTYFHYSSLYSFDTDDYYYTLIDGKWTAALVLSWESDGTSWNYDLSDYDDQQWFVNGKEVDRQDYDSAFEALGIVCSRTVWWGGRGFNLGSVQTILTKFEARIYA